MKALVNEAMIRRNNLHRCLDQLTREHFVDEKIVEEPYIYVWKCVACLAQG